jgi:hypothetical protein
MLEVACDVRLPARLSQDDLSAIAEALVAAADEVMAADRAYGT